MIPVLFLEEDLLNSGHQKSGDRITETVQFYVVITYTFVLELSKIKT